MSASFLPKIINAVSSSGGFCPTSRSWQPSHPACRYSAAVGNANLRKSNASSQIRLEVHAARASVHPACPDRQPYTHDIPLSVAFQFPSQNSNASKNSVYLKLSKSCAKARRWPTTPWSMHRAQHQRVAFAPPRAHASLPPPHTLSCCLDAHGGM